MNNTIFINDIFDDIYNDKINYLYNILKEHVYDSNLIIIYDKGNISSFRDFIFENSNIQLLENNININNNNNNNNEYDYESDDNKY